MSNIDYTLRKEWPLTEEQNEIIDFMLKRNKAICSGGISIWEQLIIIIELVKSVILMVRFVNIYYLFWKTVGF